MGINLLLWIAGSLIVGAIGGALVYRNNQNRIERTVDGVESKIDEYEAKLKALKAKLKQLKK